MATFTPEDVEFLKAQLALRRFQVTDFAAACGTSHTNIFNLLYQKVKTPRGVWADRVKEFLDAWHEQGRLGLPPIAGEFMPNLNAIHPHLYRCPRCKQATISPDAGASWCAYCGQNLDTRQCPACSHNVPPPHAYCNACGTSLAPANAAANATP